MTSLSLGGRKEIPMTKIDKSNVVPIKKDQKRKPSSTEQIWGKPVLKHGYAGIPSILIRSQHRLGLSPTQMNIILQLLDFWFDPAKPPYPTKQKLADRMGVNPKTIQNNMKALEDAGYVMREARKSSAGDWTSNIYHMDGLVEKIKNLEPEFTEAKKLKIATEKLVETPKGRRKQV